MPPSTGGGRIVGKAYLSDSEANALKSEDGWITYSAIAKNGREFFGRVQLIDSSGDSVISDIDDTIKITGITRGKKAVLENTFINPPEPAPGMSQHYRQMKRNGMAFHYLTGSPWQLFGFLDQFFDSNGFPAGSFDMKELRINPLSPEFWDAVASSATVDQKKAAIEDIIGSYPNRRFILIGDSGEHDPEIYAWAIERYGEQILEVQIRNVTNENIDNARIRTAFGASIGRLKLIDPITGETR